MRVVSAQRKLPNTIRLPRLGPQDHVWGGPTPLEPFAPVFARSRICTDRMSKSRWVHSARSTCLLLLALCGARERDIARSSLLRMKSESSDKSGRRSLIAFTKSILLDTAVLDMSANACEAGGGPSWIRRTALCTSSVLNGRSARAARADLTLSPSPADLINHRKTRAAKEHRASAAQRKTNRKFIYNSSL